MADFFSALQPVQMVFSPLQFSVFLSFLQCSRRNRSVLNLFLRFGKCTRAVRFVQKKPTFIFSLPGYKWFFWFLFDSFVLVVLRFSRRNRSVHGTRWIFYALFGQDSRVVLLWLSSWQHRFAVGSRRVYFLRDDRRWLRLASYTKISALNPSSFRGLARCRPLIASAGARSQFLATRVKCYHIYT